MKEYQLRLSPTLRREKRQQLVEVIDAILRWKHAQPKTGAARRTKRARLATREK